MVEIVSKKLRQATSFVVFLASSFLIENFPISGPFEETEVRTWEGPTGKHHC